MGIDALRARLGKKKTSSQQLSIRDVWKDGMIVDSYFPQASQFVADKGKATENELSRECGIDKKHAKLLLEQLVHYRVAIKQNGEYRSITVPSMVSRYLKKYSLKYKDLVSQIKPVSTEEIAVEEPAIEPVQVKSAAMSLDEQIYQVWSAYDEFTYEKLPQEFILSYPYFCLWRLEHRNGDPKPTKVPYDPNTLMRGSSADKSKHNIFYYCFNQLKAYSYMTGIGIGLFDDLCGIDIDDCFDEEHHLLDFAEDIINTVDSYTELSPSGKGIRIICKIPGLEYDKEKYLFKNTEKHLEMYPAGQTKRFLTLTGWAIFENRDVGIRTDEVKVLLERYMRRPERKKLKAEKSEDVISRPVYSTQRNRSSLSDEQIINCMCRKPKYKLLWEGKWREAGYPSQSEGDCAFVCKLAFLADKNPEQMDRIYRMSGLMRPKWDDRRVDSTVGKNLIQFAIDGCESTVTDYNVQKRKAEVSKLFETKENC